MPSVKLMRVAVLCLWPCCIQHSHCCVTLIGEHPHLLLACWET